VTHHPDKSKQWWVAQEYSAELQLQVLHLTLGDVREPILDIGCGKECSLVRLFRSRGLNAIGIDLDVNPGVGGVSVDWFDFPYVPGYFGTIIAHLSFTLHFLKHHLDPSGDAEGFAKQYLRILRALKVGGRMIYAPGLPFIESLLPAQDYRVSRHTIEHFPIDVQAGGFYTQQLGEDPMYACHVERTSVTGG
jgi:hypothetical protein